MIIISQRKCFKGTLGFYSHESKLCNGNMNFSVFTPSIAKTKKCPVVYYLSGLSCTDENFMMKAGAQRVCEELEIILVAPDTSPRDRGIPGEKDGGRPGEGASYYIDATKGPWSKFYQMYSYIVYELPAFIDENFPTIKGLKSIMGHSMGGHGALIIGLRNPTIFSSVSALAPIVAPHKSEIAKKAIGILIGEYKENEKIWSQYDSYLFLKENNCTQEKILIDQGKNDEFFEVLGINDFKLLIHEKNLPIDLRIHDGYDHSYYFVSSFIEDHIRFHAKSIKNLHNTNHSS